MALLVHVLPDLVGKLVSVLTGSWHPHSPRPVVVQMSQLVSQLLQYKNYFMWKKQVGSYLEMIRLETRGIFDNIVASGVNCPLAY